MQPITRHPGFDGPFAEGERVMLTDRKGRRYLQTLSVGEVFHFHGGQVRHDDVLGRPEGSTVVSSKQWRLQVVRLTGVDWTLKAPRGAQVVYPKDQALIVTYGDIAPGTQVLEAGAGSGALTAALLRAVGPTGSVTSYELRPEHAEVARSNVVQRFGTTPDSWTLCVGDVVEYEGSCDRLVLDLLDPARAVAALTPRVRPGGHLVAYTPTVPPMSALREHLAADDRWGAAETFEALLRPWHVDGLAVRPDHRMVAHTAFLTVARRLAG